ncbi:MAG: ATP-binding protein [Lautropia sp.]
MVVALTVALLLGLRTLLDPIPTADVLRIDRAHFYSGLDDEPDEIVRRAFPTYDGINVRGGERVLPHDWRNLEAVTEGWYRIEQSLNVAPDRIWAIWLPRIAMNASVYLNGRLIGRHGQVEDGVTRNWNRPLYFLIPNGLLQPGSNVLAIHVVADRAGAGLMREIYLAPAEVLGRFHDLRTLAATTVLYTIVGLMLVTALLTMGLWLLRPSDTLFGWYALMLAAWATHDVYHLVTDSWIEPLVLEWLWHTSLVGFVVTVTMFTSRFLELHDPPFERRLGVWMLASAPLLAFAAVAGDTAFHQFAAPISDTVALGVAILPLVQVTQRFMAARSYTVGAMMFSGGFSLLAGFHDWLVVTALLPRTHGYLMPYASVPILAVFGVILARRFSAALAELERMNVELEARIAARERVISANYERLREIERMHAMMQERTRLMRDIHDGVGNSLISTLAMVEHGNVGPDDIAAALRTAITDMRLTIDSLDDVDGDLGAVLGTLRHRLGPRLQAAGLAVCWDVGDLPPMPHLQQADVLQVLRIVQEALNNVLKHAGASRVTICAGPCTGDPAVVAIEIRDDGRGFSHDAIVRGRGLRNMRDRAASIGGRVSVRSNRIDGRGCSVRLTVPRSQARLDPQPSTNRRASPGSSAAPSG